MFSKALLTGGFLCSTNNTPRLSAVTLGYAYSTYFAAAPRCRTIGSADCSLPPLQCVCNSLDHCQTLIFFAPGRLPVLSLPSVVLVESTANCVAGSHS